MGRKANDMKRFFAVLLCTCTLFCLAGCSSYPLKNRGAASVTFYDEPHEEESAFDQAGWYGQWSSLTIKYSDALTLRRYVNSIRDWQDDNAVGRLPFTFVGQFEVLNNDHTYFFTEDGTVYFDHYYGRLSDKGLEFLLSFREAAAEAEAEKQEEQQEPGELTITLYAEPMSDGIVLNTETYSKALEGATLTIPTAAEAEKLLGIVESIPGWTDDNIVDRMPFTFIGEFKLSEKEHTYYFTADGTLYYDHYFAELNEEDTAFLLSLCEAGE